MEDRNQKKAKKVYSEDQGKVIEKGSLLMRLKQQVDELTELIRGLESNGPRRPFKKSEKALVRNVYLAAVQELSEELPVFFLLDNREEFENCQEQLHGWMQEIQDL